MLSTKAVKGLKLIDEYLNCPAYVLLQDSHINLDKTLGEIRWLQDGTLVPVKKNEIPNNPDEREMFYYLNAERLLIEKWIYHYQTKNRKRVWVTIESILRENALEKNAGIYPLSLEKFEENFTLEIPLILSGWLVERLISGKLLELPPIRTEQ